MKWIPISEQMPPLRTEVLAVCNGYVTIAEWCGGDEWFIQEGNSNATTEDIEAWTELPKPFNMLDLNADVDEIVEKSEEKITEFIVLRSAFPLQNEQYFISGELVRCINCKKLKGGICEVWNTETQPYGFCYMAERIV